jgi:two-component system sensor histidine kinase KdpD
VQVIENALKYSPPESRVSVRLSAADDVASISVHNDGSSIAPAEAQLIFRRYYRSPSVEQRAPGTGLGLSIAKQAVEAHGGQITLLSEVAEETTFVITLPITGGIHERISTHR